jgi:hypothetical protein
MRNMSLSSCFSIIEKWFIIWQNIINALIKNKRSSSWTKWRPTTSFIRRRWKKDNKKYHRKSKMMDHKKWMNKKPITSSLQLKMRIYSESIKKKLILTSMIPLIEHHINRNTSSNCQKELKKLINLDMKK